MVIFFSFSQRKTAEGNGEEIKVDVNNSEKKKKIIIINEICAKEHKTRFYNVISLMEANNRNRWRQRDQRMLRLLRKSCVHVDDWITYPVIQCDNNDIAKELAIST